MQLMLQHILKTIILGRNWQTKRAEYRIILYAFGTCMQKMSTRLAITNNSVEGWHNAIKSSFPSLHPSLYKFLLHLQGEQGFEEARLIKWEKGDVPKRSKENIARNERLYHLVSDYVNRGLLTYLRGISYNFEF